MKKYQRNQNYIVSGETFNEIAEAVNWTKENQAKLLGTEAFSKTFQNGEIRIKYLDEETLPTFSAVAIDDLAIIPEDNKFNYETQTFNANKVTSENAEKPFAICVEPANQGKLTKAILSGITPAKVTIQDAAHGFAKPTDGNGALESCETGTAKILWKAGDSGEQWCILQLGVGAAGSGSDDFPFKIEISGGGTTPPEIQIQNGYVSLQKGEEKFLFSIFPNYNFDSLEDGRYLISGWISRIPAGSSNGFFISPENTKFPTGPGFYVFPIALIEKYIPEPDPEADPEADPEEETYCQIELIEQYAWGNFTIPDRYYGLPFVPHLNVSWGNNVYVTKNSFNVSAMIVNAPSDLSNGLEDQGINIQLGQQYNAYIEEPADNIPRLAWRSTASNDIEKKTLVASIKHKNDGSLEMELYHLTTYQKLLVRANVESPDETINVGAQGDIVQIDVNYEKFTSEDGTVNIEPSADGGLDFSVNIEPGAAVEDGPFSIKYNDVSGMIEVAAGYMNANGEWMNVAGKQLVPQNGIICVFSTISGGTWSTPDIKFATPDKNNFPIGKCTVTNGKVTVSSFRVPVAIMIETISCPYENLGLESGDDNSEEPI